MSAVINIVLIEVYIYIYIYVICALINYEITIGIMAVDAYIITCSTLKYIMCNLVICLIFMSPCVKTVVVCVYKLLTHSLVVYMHVQRSDNGDGGKQ